jgi:uncharacterized repeat protein (TIGR01451 family)
MRRVFDFCKRTVKRVNARIAVLVVVVLLGTVAVWQGFAHMAKTGGPKGPTKQIATGLPSEPSLDPTVQPATATLTDDQLPGSTGNGYSTASYGQGGAASPATQAQTNPYLPQNGDGYGTGSGYGGAASNTTSSRRGQYGVSDAPATSVPADPTVETAEGVPENPYRPEIAESGPAELTAGGLETNGPPATSPYATAGQTASTPEVSPGGSEVSPGGEPPGEYAAQEPAVLNAPPATTPIGGVDLGERAAPLQTNALPQAMPRALPADSAAVAAGSGAAAAPTPGERQLEGPQQPAIALEKFSPAEIQVGKPAVFEMLVKNTGAVPAQNVVISDHVPAGTQLIDAKPQPQQGSDGSLVWTLGTMQPGEEVAITLQVMPQQEGEIGSTAHVTFAAAATSRSICTRPQLTIEHTAPPKILIGESLTVGITVSNPGTGPATGVIIEEDIPEGLSHVAGAQLEYEVGMLRPGESKRLELSIKAEKAGVIQNTIHAHGEGGLAAQHTVQIEVVAPQLSVEVDGPKRRFLERQATYTLSIANPGTAPARDVELAAFLPRGMKFFDTDSQGQYDAAQHAVFWSLEELPPSKAGAVKLTAMPIEPGEQRLRIEGRAGLGLSAEGEQVVQVEQSAELVHSVSDAEEVIEVGSETVYEVRVQNTGTKAATNVRVAALMPPEMQAIGGEGPTRATGDALKVVFEPLARLNPQEEVVFKVQVKGVKPGDHIVRVQLASDEWPTPVTREESTRVYEDR